MTNQQRLGVFTLVIMGAMALEVMAVSTLCYLGLETFGAVLLFGSIPVFLVAAINHEELLSLLPDDPSDQD